MSVKKVLLLPGDGIGPEQTEQTVRIMKFLNAEADAKLEIEYALMGGAAIDATGVPLPEETLRLAKSSDAVLKAPIGGSKWEKLPREKLPETGLLAIRKELGTYANLRPAKMFEEMIDSSPLKPEVVKGVDIMFVRELIGGLYFGKTGVEKLSTGERFAYNTMEYKDTEIKRVARTAFEIARRRRKKLCSVDKSNVLNVMQLWRDVVNEVHMDYKDVELTHMYVDNASAQMIFDPSQFCTIVTENMFGDILSDESAVLVGRSLGMLPSASLGDLGYAIYEPMHGSAPNIAGQGIANPISMILSLGMMFEYSFGNKDLADKIENATKQTLAKGYRTKDIYTAGGNAIEVGTKQMADAIIAELGTMFR